MGRKLDIVFQAAFISRYDSLPRFLEAGDVVIFSDAVHQTYASRLAGCWQPKGEKLVLNQTARRQRINLHGGIDLESGRIFIHQAETIGALSTS